MTTNHIQGDEPQTTFYVPKNSNWQCTWTSMTFVPFEGKEPNWFHRKMQELCFGVKWSKRK